MEESLNHLPQEFKKNLLYVKINQLEKARSITKSNYF